MSVLQKKKKSMTEKKRRCSTSQPPCNHPPSHISSVLPRGLVYQAFMHTGGVTARVFMLNRLVCHFLSSAHAVNNYCHSSCFKSVYSHEQNRIPSPGMFRQCASCSVLLGLPPSSRSFLLLAAFKQQIETKAISNAVGVWISLDL